jgi:hypothetical protein
LTGNRVKRWCLADKVLFIDPQERPKQMLVMVNQGNPELDIIIPAAKLTIRFGG